MERERIIFDLDDVIVVPNILKIANEITGKDKKLEDLKHYYIEEGFSFTEKQDELFYNELVQRNLYEDCKLIEGAYEALQEFSKLYDVFIASDSVIYKRERLSSRVFADKFTFIVNTLPFINPRNIILCGDKSIISGKWFVDDKLENLEKAKNVQYKLIFPAYHNIDIPDEELIQKDIVRIKDYSHLDRFIKGNLTDEEIIETIDKVFNLCYRDVNINVMRREECIVIHNESKDSKYFLGSQILAIKLNKLLGISVNIL